MIPSLLVLGKARRLDRAMPGWADRIKINKLDFTSANYCVLGQVYGNMHEAPIFLGGMCLFPIVMSFAFLEDFFGTRKRKTWINCIKKRQTQAQQPPLYVPLDWTHAAQKTERIDIVS